MSAKKQKASITFLLFCVAALIILLLTSVNLGLSSSTKNVLGAESPTQKVGGKFVHEGFWRQFLAQNPDYIPGWIEVNEYDKVFDIDPNYFIP